MELIPHVYTMYESMLLNPALTSVLLATTIVVVFLSIIFLRSSDNANNDKVKDDPKTTKASSAPLKDVFSHMRSTSSGTSGKTPTSSDKPFSSSYYYAHNSMSTTGGYKDGLSITDYTMNGPRLLSKNGVPIDDSNDSPVSEADEIEEQAPDESKDKVKSSSVTPQTKSSSIPITKFSWEDTLEYARIRIDSIPSPESTSTNKIYIPWEEASISKSQVTVNLEGKRTLQIKLQSTKSDKEQLYHLNFQNLYGDIKEAKAFWKQHKLIIRLKKAAFKEWKELVQKDVLIDENLFRRNE